VRLRFWDENFGKWNWDCELELVGLDEEKSEALKTTSIEILSGCSASLLTLSATVHEISFRS